MSEIKSKGIVLKEKNYGESDKLVTVLFKDIGKLNVYARGSRKSTSKFLAGTQLFSYTDFRIKEGKGFFYVASGSVIKAFMPEFKDFETLYTAAYFVEITDGVVMENAASNGILLLLLRALKSLSAGNVPPRVIMLAFMLRIMELSGFAPLIDVCVMCGRPASDGVLSPLLGGSLCENCKSSGDAGTTFKLSKSARNAMEYILNSDISKIFSFRISDKLYVELKKIVFSCFKHQIGGEYKTLEMLEVMF